MATNPVDKLKASIEAQRLQREAAIATSRRVSDAIDEKATKTEEEGPQE